MVASFVDIDIVNRQPEHFFLIAIFISIQKEMGKIDVRDVVCEYKDHCSRTKKRLPTYGMFDKCSRTTTCANTRNGSIIDKCIRDHYSSKNHMCEYLSSGEIDRHGLGRSKIVVVVICVNIDRNGQGLGLWCF